MQPNKQQLINRGNNLVSMAVVTLSGFAFLPETKIEDKRRYKIDDGLLFILGLGALWWYNHSNNRFSRSVVPILFTLAALAIKIMAIVIEHHEADDVGDDFGALVLFILANALAIWLFIKNKPTKAVK